MTFKILYVWVNQKRFAFYDCSYEINEGILKIYEDGQSPAVGAFAAGIWAMEGEKK